MVFLRKLLKTSLKVIFGFVIAFVSLHALLFWSGTREGAGKRDVKELPFDGPRVSAMFQIPVRQEPSTPSSTAGHPAADSKVPRSARDEARDALACATTGRCAKYVPSTSMEPIEVVLGRATRRPQQPEQTRHLRVQLARAFIDWATHLQPGPHSQVTVNAALPDLGPESVLKDGMRGGGYSKESRNEAHRSRVPITLHPAGSGVPAHCEGITSPRCSPHLTERLLQSDIGDGGRYKVPCKESVEGFDCWVPEDKTASVMQQQILVPRQQTDIGTTFLNCETRPNQLYLWCTVWAQPRPDLWVRYQFSRTHLRDYGAIHEKVKTFVAGLIVESQMVPVPIDSEA